MLTKSYVAVTSIESSHSSSRGLFGQPSTQAIILGFDDSLTRLVVAVRLAIVDDCQIPVGGTINIYEVIPGNFFSTPSLHSPTPGSYSPITYRFTRTGEGWTEESLAPKKGVLVASTSWWNRRGITPTSGSNS